MIKLIGEENHWVSTAVFRDARRTLFMLLITAAYNLIGAYYVSY